MQRTLSIVAAALGALLLAQPASAATAAVTYDDLDLSTPRDQKELDRRIDDAARTACGAHDLRTGTRIPSADAKACVKNAKRQLGQKIAAARDVTKAGGSSSKSPAEANPSH